MISVHNKRETSVFINELIYFGVILTGWSISTPDESNCEHLKIDHLVVAIDGDVFRICEALCPMLQSSSGPS